LACSVSRVKVALSIVSLVTQLFSFRVGCKGIILKGFGFVAFFAGNTGHYYYYYYYYSPLKGHFKLYNARMLLEHVAKRHSVARIYGTCNAVSHDNRFVLLH
jgi:hypothetical protein